MKKFMAKSGQKMIITKNLDGKVVIIRGNSRVSVDTQNMSKWEEFQAVKDAILKMGVVFTRRIEKNVRKSLFS